MIDWLPPEWFAAITSSTAMAILGFAVGTYYKAKVEKTVQHNFDARIEHLRAGFRKEEETLRDDLRAKGEQISALRGGALSGELLSNLVFEACRSCGDLVGVCGFNSVFERDACDDFGQVIKAA